MRLKRAAVMEARGAQLSAEVCAAIAGSRLYAAARTIAAYLAFKDEIDLTPLWTDSEKLWVVPRIARAGTAMSFHVLEQATLVRHRFGQQEPVADAEEVPAAGIDLVLVPGLAFDHGGGRLGYGRGYYDRFLNDVPAAVPTVGVTLDELIVPAVPRDDHDVPVTHLVTESGLRPVAQPGAAARSRASS